MTDLLSADELGFLDPSKLNYWVGSTPPLPGFVSSLDVLDSNTDFRVDPDLHGSFDGVFFVEHDLGQVKQWRLVLDELLHLTNGTGTLVIRYYPYRYVNSHELLTAIDAWTGGRAEVLFSRRWADDRSKVIGLRLSAEPRRRSLDSLTFGLVADGRFPERITRFVDSVMLMDGIDEVDYEVLVCGPAGAVDHIDQKLTRTRLVEQSSRFADLGWITNKKNRLVAAAAGDTVVLAHDRYSFTPGFLTNLKEFGPDFDVLVPAQRTVEGFRYPARVASTDLWNIASVGELQPGDYTPSMYVNGGIMIASTEVLRATRFNELLFWAEAEDVELTRRLANAGVVARFSESVVVLTDLTRSDQVSVFQRFPYSPEYLTPDLLGPKYLVGTTLSFTSASRAEWLADHGVTLPQAWHAQPDGLHWSATRSPEISVRPRVPEGVADRRWSLTLGVRGGRHDVALTEAWVNGRRAPLVGTSSRGQVTDLTFAIPDDLANDSDTFNVQLTSADPAGFVLATLRLDLDLERASFPLEVSLSETFTQPSELVGWSHAEAWGRWSVGERASVAVPAPPIAPDHDVLVTAEIQPHLPAGTGEQRVVVNAAGVPLEIWTFTEAHLQKRTLTVPASLVTRGWLEIGFEIAWPSAPLDETGSGDHRRLGIALHSLTAREIRQARA
ncbi:hypothetical protein [Frondihabitans cladoniiphilus]|uniref:Glycosyl transferase family 2 n=1 Tax=Frondihabitans cladoniiphilus TaxID=715785 RepID=A0ABP8W635_9MICO